MQIHLCQNQGNQILAAAAITTNQTGLNTFNKVWAHFNAGTAITRFDQQRHHHPAVVVAILVTAWGNGLATVSALVYNGKKFSKQERLMNEADVRVTEQMFRDIFNDDIDKWPSVSTFTGKLAEPILHQAIATVRGLFCETVFAGTMSPEEVAATV